MGQLAAQEALLRAPRDAPAGPSPAGARPAPGLHARHVAVLLAADLAGAAAATGLARPSVPTLVSSALVVVAALGLGLARPRLVPSWLDDLPRLVLAGAAGAVGGALVAGPGSLARCAAAAGAVVAGRSAAYPLMALARRRGLLVHRAVVVGCGDLAAQLAGVLQRPEHGIRLLGFVDDEPRLPEGLRPLPVVGTLADLPRLVRENRLDTVVVGWSNTPETVVVDVIRGCDRLPVEIWTVPRFWQVQSVDRGVETLRGIPLAHLRRPAFRAPTWRLKRLLDVVVSALALVVLSPVLAACALAVRLEAGPGVLFRQVRVGLDGREVVVLKLRSMRPATAAESATLWSIGTDERVGRVGRLLRRSSLDELPQLWNVLRGEMSLVGPRPERPHFVERFSREHDEYLWRHRVPCGLTGWAQVNGLRGDTSIAERARFDNYYIENWSLWLDAKILLRTVLQVVGAAGR